jgi:hypothetical protein
MENRVYSQQRVIMRIELLPQAREHLTALSSRLGMTQVAIASRLVDWLCGEHDVVQAAVLGLYPDDIRSDLPSKIFKRMAAGRKKPALA